ncbi:hypothetical protein SOVF_080040 [Spinacia oleracea]|nr:hypothetical protein SOVF_080040 [Spinacia oleracea]
MISIVATYQVGQNTTISLGRRCKNLEFLDLSWCRLLIDKALGLIADSCWSLKLLKIFGCTQVVQRDKVQKPHEGQDSGASHRSSIFSIYSTS